MKNKTARIVWGVTRISLGSIFLWAFVDKVFGLSFSTAADKAWLAGSSPTVGFLKFGTRGPFAQMYQSLAGQVWVDWLFMMGLLGVGLALVLGIGMRIATRSGTLLLIMMYLAAWPPEHHPVMDEHIIYALVLVTMNYSDGGDYIGLGKWWRNQKLVKKFPVLV